ncbi:MAG: YCF48-related protein [Chitinophagales bacterium]
MNKLISFFFCFFPLLALLACNKEKEPFTESSCTEVLDRWAINTVDYFNNSKSDLFFTSNEVGYVVGIAGTILKTSNGGLDWELTNYKKTTSNSDRFAHLQTIYFIDESIGYIGGKSIFDFSTNTHSGAVLLHTSDGGENWAERYFENVLNIHDLIFFDQENGLGLFTVRNEDDNSELRMVKTNNKGETWNEIPLPLKRIRSYQFTATSSFLIIWGSDEYNKSFILKSKDNGLNWQIASNPQPNNATLSSMYFIDEEFGFAICGRAIYQTKDSGNSWKEISSPMNSHALIHFSSRTEGFVFSPVFEVFEGNFEPLLVLKFYEVFQTIDGGMEWTKTEIPKECDFTGLSYSPSKNTLFSIGKTINRFDIK